MKLENKQGCYVISAFVALILVGILEAFWPEVIPFNFFDVWASKTPFIEGVVHIWPVLLWALVISITIACSRKPRLSTLSSKDILRGGFLISLWAGIAEEICFRWLIFYGAIATITFGNWIFFGWLGFGLAQWLYLHIGGPIADFITFRQLHDVLFSAVLPWTVGAALLSSNGEFEKGHEYQGCLGQANAKFTGLFFFWLMLNYGLLTAIVAHFLYDMIVFSVEAIAANDWETKERRAVA